MEIKFLKSCGTVNANYAKGGVYSLPKEVAQQFIKEGLAEAVKKEVKRPRKTTKKAE